MEKNQTSYKLSGLLGLLCLAVLQMSQLCASKRTSLKSQSNYTQAGRTKRSDKYHIIDENFNFSNNDPLDKDLANRDNSGNPLDVDGNSIKVGTRKAFASGSSKRDKPFTLDNQKFYLERRAEQAKDRQPEKESRENRLTDLGIKLEDLLDRKDIGRDSR
ncbi:MAG: hypothetical protein NTU89_00610, partial [Candidatus Dependentiae bacterium]|nr:hypothetical protein [Candidatus Dependentiae bacterium]